MNNSTSEDSCHVLRMIIAEDDDFIRGFFTRVVRRMGHEVVAETASGRELVEFCLPLKPDLVITNIRMEELNGLDAIAEIGRVLPTKTIVISAEDPAESLDPQVVDYLVKPVKLEEFERAIQCICDSALNGV